MSKNNHTPGPWEVSFTDCLGRPASYCRIRPINKKMFGHFTSLEIATMNMMDEDEQQANARLISAAPELLAALDELTNGYAGNGWDVGLVTRLEKARAAIAKATDPKFGEEE